jgi:hypothetical protein
MGLKEIKKRWSMLNGNTQLADDISKLIAVAEAAKPVLEWVERNRLGWSDEASRLEKALAELEGE